MSGRWGELGGALLLAAIILGGCEGRFNPPFSSGVNVNVTPPQGTGVADPQVREIWSPGSQLPRYDDYHRPAYPDMPSPQ